MKSPEATVNEIMETITSNENDTSSKESTWESTNEDYLLNPFKQYVDFAKATLDWLGTDSSIVICETSIKGTCATYHITVQEKPTTVLFGQIYHSFPRFLNPCLNNPNY